MTTCSTSDKWPDIQQVIQNQLPNKIHMISSSISDKNHFQNIFHMTESTKENALPHMISSSTNDSKRVSKDKIPDWILKIKA